MGAQRSDLPDPLEKVPPGATAATADDLLAQMAGEEIQRLLADIARQPLPSEAAAPVAPAQAAGFVAPASDLDAETARQIDALFEKLTGSDSPQAPSREPAPAAIAASEEPAPAALLAESQTASEKVVSSEPATKVELAIAQESAPAPGSVPNAPVSAAGIAPQSAAPAASKVDPAEQTTSLERQVLAAEVMNAARALSEQTLVPEPRPRDDGRLPLYLRPLEWLNAPVAGCSDAARELMARIALATLAVSLFILIYVSFIRHH